MCLFWFKKRKNKDPEQPEMVTEQLEPTEQPEPMEEEKNMSDQHTPPEESTLPPGCIPEGSYSSSQEHFRDELQRIDMLVRAQTLRWRMTLAADKPEHLWGMIHVTDAEVNRYLSAPYCPPAVLPHELENQLHKYWDAADQIRLDINERLKLTPQNILLRLQQLQMLFGLSDLELDILLVCLLPALDVRYRRLYGYLMDDASRNKATVELVIQILYPVEHGSETVRAYLEEGSSLITHELLVSDGNIQGTEPLALRSLRVDDRIEAFLLDSNEIDGQLKDVIFQPKKSVSWEQLTDDSDSITPISQLKGLSKLWKEKNDAHAVLLLQGPYGSGRQPAAQAICNDISKPLLIADIQSTLQPVGNWKQTVALVYREALLQGAAVCWKSCELLFEREQPAGRWEYLLEAAEIYPSLSFLASQSAPEPSFRFRNTPFLRLIFPVPDYKLRFKLWQIHMPQFEIYTSAATDSTTLARLLANSFQLTEGQILDAVATARWRAMQRNPEQPQLSSDDLYDGCRRQSGQRLLRFARRIEPRSELSFDNLIVPVTNRRQLKELRQRIRCRCRIYTELGFERRLSLGKGLIALFTGSSGTGKTMAAELLAHEQRVDLYKVDLSSIVSKYVGETEKNLSKVFAEAEDANAILLFDEADALFGKRGEVKEAQDRWANMEVNYLLQRVEEYAGVVILTSNLRQNIDEAFLRRIQVIVDFPFPDADARLHILCGLFPEGIERPEESKLKELAERFKLSGGNFKNIVLDAAFRPFDKDCKGSPEITQRHLVAATAREYQKLGKPLTKSDFGEEFYGWVTEDILCLKRHEIKRK